MGLVEVENASFGYDRQNMPLPGSDAPRVKTVGFQGVFSKKVCKKNKLFQKNIIFENIYLKVNKGEIFCLVGPNGCGKTTLLDCILGIKKLNNGVIYLGGKNINSIKTSHIAKEIAYVPQVHEKTFPYTVMEIVLMGRASHNGIFSVPSKEDMDIAEECIGIVGISRLKNRPYTLLSGGEGQLVMLARALAQKAPLIIMDEPTAHLDFNHEMTILETIVTLVKNTGLSVIMATHFPNHAFYFENNNVTTNIALMSDKRFSSFGSPSDVLTEENLSRLYCIKAKVVSFNLEDNVNLKQIIPICINKN